MIEIKNVSYNYGNKKILQNINLRIQNQEKIAIIGESGCGKTTFLNLIIGNLRPHTGKILFDKQDIQTLLEKGKKYFKQNVVSNVFQNLQLLENETVLENLLYFGHKEEIMNLLKQFQLVDLLPMKIAKLSGGQKQKIAILRAFLLHTQVLVLDEITSSLDRKSAEEIVQMIEILYHDKIVLFVTHDLASISNFVNTIITIQNGKIQKRENIPLVFNPKTSPSLHKRQKISFHYRFSCIHFLVFLLSTICLFFSFSFTDIYHLHLCHKMKQYYDADIVYLENFEKQTKIENLQKDLMILENIDNYFHSFQLFIDEQTNFYFQWKPVFQKDTILIFNDDFYQINNLDNITKITLKYQNERLDITNIGYIKEDNLFTNSYIYYNYSYFANYFKNFSFANFPTTYIGVVQTNIIQCYQNSLLETAFMPHPFFTSSNEKKTYLHSNALLEYLLYQELFQSYFQICHLLTQIVIIFTMSTLIFLYFLNFKKKIKKIAILYNFGYSFWKIIAEDFFSICIDTCAILGFSIFIFSFFSIHFLSFFLFSLCLVFLLHLGCLCGSYFYFKRKELQQFLLEESLC